LNPFLSAVGNEIGSSGDHAVFPGHDSLDVKSIGNVTHGFGESRGGAAMGVDVLQSVRSIKLSQESAVVDVNCSTFEDDHVVSITEVRESPIVASEVACLLG
jgi:hypothetical protein